MLAYSAVDADACAAELGRVWKTIWAFLESTNPPTRKAAAESLNLLSQCFTTPFIQEAIQESKTAKAEHKSVLGSIVAQTTKALDSLAFARSMLELLSVISSLIQNVRYRDNDRELAPGEAAESLLIPLIQQIGDLRTQKGFEHKEAADATLATAMRVLGPKVVLEVLPLNLEPADR